MAGPLFQSLDEERWRELLPLFDHAMDLEPSAREAWLAQLALERPTTAASLRALLTENERLEAQRFLEEGPLSKDAESLQGCTVGAYTIEQLIGEGGMGEVWRARRSDGRFERKVAVKLMHASLVSRRARERFEREGRLLARLTHPNIAPLVDAGVTAGNRPYIVLEYVDGQPLDRYCDLRGLGIEARLRLFQDVLSALAHAHDRLVIHRDLKPSNVLVTGPGVVKLLDFGIAKLMDAQEDDTAPPTSVGEVAFTPDYAAPEQVLGEPISAATDVYQLGVLLYLLLAGNHPYARPGMGKRELLKIALDREPPLASDAIARMAENDPKELAKRAEGRGTTPQRLRAALRGDLDAILAKTLRKHPTARYSSAAALASDIASYLEHRPVAARSGALRYRTRKFLRRHRAVVATGSFAALALISTTVFALVQMREAQVQRDEAQAQSESASAERRFTLLMMSKVGSGGHAMTMEQILDSGMELVDKEFADRPEFAVDSLVHLSGRYMDIGNTRKEHAALAKAERIARRVSPAKLAEVECDTVETEIALGDFVAAERRVHEAQRALAPVRKPNPRLVSDCLHAEGSLNAARGRMPEAIANVQGAIAAIADTDDNSVRLTGLQSHLELLYASIGDITQAMKINRERQALVRESGLDGSVRLLRAQHSQAMYLADVGQIKDALALDRDVVTRSTPKDGAPMHPTVSEGYGEVLLRMERPDAALPWLDQAARAWHAQGGTGHELVVRTLRSHALLQLGRADEARGELPDLTALAQALDQTSRQSFVRAGTARAGVLLALGDLAHAREQISQVVDQVRTSADCARWKISALLMAARVADAVGSVSEAGYYAAEALELAQQRALQAERSADVGEALLVLANLRREEGDLKAAAAMIPHARVALSDALGARHSLTRAALAFN
jgi:serine/threonine-protein kinase